MDQPGKPHQNADTITPAKKFMDSNTTDQKAMMDKMSNVFHIEEILPEGLSTWNKTTTILVLEKTLVLCGISIGTEEKTDEEMKTEQDKIQKQIEMLKVKKERNSALLRCHQIEKEMRNLLNEQIANCRKKGQLNRELGIPAEDGFDEELNVQNFQNELNKLDSPLID